MNFPSFEALVEALKHYQEGATIPLPASEGTIEHVKIRGGVWEEGDLIFQGVVPDDPLMPYRNIYVREQKVIRDRSRITFEE